MAHLAAAFHRQYAAATRRDSASGSWESDDDDDEESQLSNEISWQGDNDEEAQLSSPSLLNDDEGHLWPLFENDEESQASSQPPSDADDESQLSQPPQVIQVNLQPVDIRSEDVQMINSILSNIKDPAIRAALENIVGDQTNDWRLSSSNYVNQPNPSQHSWSPIDVLYDGLLYAGFDLDRLQNNNIRRKIEWFKSFYGVEHTTVAPYLSDLRKKYADIDYKDCFMALNWLTLYEIYPVLSARWKRSEEYIGKKVIENVMKMAELARKKIRLELEHDVELGRTIDCATFMIQEMRLDPNSKWFDWKTHSAGLKYEFCLAIWEPRVTWINGPEEPSKHDITVYRGGDAGEEEENRDQSALYFQLQEGEKLVGDSGYNGEPDKIVVTKDEQSPELKNFLARAKNRQETFHWRLKSFNILGHRFRHGVNPQHRMDLHKMAVWAVAGIVQYDYENGHPPFDI